MPRLHLLFYLGLLIALAPVLGSQTSNREHETRWEGYGGGPRLSKEEQLGRIHPALPKTHLLSATQSYFEVDDDAHAEDEVVGRINLANNSFESVEFAVTGGSGEGFFTVESVVNSIGKPFGAIRLKTDTLTENSYTLRVKGTFSGGETHEQTYTIHRVEEPLAERFLRWKEEEYFQHRRLSRSAPDDTIQLHLATMQENGAFADLPLGMGRDGWQNTCKSAERLLMMATAYLDAESRFYKSAELKDALYEGIIRNARQNARFRTDWADTHVWRNSDFIAGIGIRFFRLLRSEMASSDLPISRRAFEVYDAILDVCDVLWAERMNERPAIGNANRNHRMRSLITRAALSYDYNRALTDQDIWFDPVDPRIPGYYPDGCLGDVMELIETGFVFMDTYDNRNGFFPDGTICHHPRVGLQFTADAYGWEWLTENSIPMANFLKNTRYQASDFLYNTIADRILDAYRPLTYDGFLDMSVGGFLPDRSKWGPRLLDAVSRLLEAQSASTTIAREEELRQFKVILESHDFADPLTLNQPFWNIDYLVHRRPHYFASAKMISTRSRGLERGVDRRSYYYLGDGALLVRVNPDDYNGIHDAYNWHAIPGTTTEQRLDALPLAADSPFPGAHGTNQFAGVVSDGRYGFGAFVYERNHPDEEVNYSTVNAHKAYFFFDQEILALGNNVRRVRPGDGQAIWTTLEQIKCRGPVQFSIDGRTTEKTPWKPGNRHMIRRTFKQHAWFHHDQTGYVILAQSRPVEVHGLIEHRSGTNIFQLAIDHGNDPDRDEYEYIVLPKVTAEETAAFVSRQGSESPITVLKNNDRVIAVYHRELNLSQVAFYEAGSLPLPFVSGDLIQLSVDRAALVMIRKQGDYLDITVTDPIHSTSEDTVHLTLDCKLTGPRLSYDVPSGMSRLAFQHDGREVWAGKPVSARYQLK